VKAVVASLAIVAVVTAAVIGIRFAPREPLATRIPSSTAVFDEHGRLLRLTLRAISSIDSGRR
jgi:penicillin-binding protein 1C